MGVDNKSENITEKYLLNAWSGNSRCIMPVLAKSEAPVIDGKIDENEWRKSTKLAGFHIYGKGLVPGERGFAYFATDKENLYVGIRTSAPNNDPGCGLISKTQERDGAVYSDDSVEIMISPDSEPNIVYHLIVNPTGVIFDRKCTYEPKDEDISWNFKNIKAASVAESGYWDLELKIPFSEIGSPKQFIMMNIARNWSEIGSSALVPTANHLDRKNMFYLNWRDQAPSIKMNELGSPDEGTWNVKVSVDNPTVDKEFIAAGMLRKVTWPKVNGKIETRQTIEKTGKQIIPAKGKSDLILDHNADREMHYLSTVIFDPKNGEILYSRLISGKKGFSTGRHPASASFEIPDICRGQLFYYPGFNRAALQTDFNPGLKIESVKAFVADKNGGKTFTVMRKENKYYRALLPVGSEIGEYTFGIELKTGNSKPIEFNKICKVTKRNFKWENNDYGKDKIIIPPFIPIKTEGTTVILLDRKHKVNFLGLWDSLEIKGCEQLVGPMEIECIIDGKKQQWEGKAPLLKIEDDGYAARASTSAKSNIGMILESELYFEYDGFYWVKMQLKNTANRKIEKLTLTIPMKNEESPMFHAVSNTIRTNPAGNIPPGNGIVWDGAQLKRSTIFGKTTILPQLVPYIWIGGPEKGLCWFLDSSYGYKLETDIPSVRIIRNENKLYLEVDIINKPIKIKDGHSFEFGMQATPVKPLERKWRKVVYDSSGEGIKGMDTAQCAYSGLLGYVYNWSKLPYKNDFSLFENVLKVLRGTAQNSTYKDWMRKNGNEIQNIIRKVPSSNDECIKHYVQVRENFFNFTFDKRNPPPVIIYMYSDPRLTFVEEDEADYFKSEWWSPQPQSYFGAYRVFPVSSCLDFMIYGYYQQLKYGMQGIYIDDSFIMPTNNTDTLARIDDEGQVHSCIGILAMRELFKRIAVMQHQFSCKPRLLITHMTNALIVPCFSFATSQLSWESMFGETPLQERYTLDAIRAIDTGLHAGLDPVALGGVLRKTSDYKTWQQKEPFLTRTVLAMTLPHGVKIWHRWSPNDIYWPVVKKIYGILSEFEHWQKDCKFVPYWDNYTALKADSDDVIISSYRRPNTCLIIVSNIKKEEVKFNLSVDAEKLGLPEKFNAIDSETGKFISLKEIAIEGYDFKLICLYK